MAQNNGVTPAVEDVRSKLIAAVEKKKKENKIVPLLESLFEFHIDASLLDALISLISHESRKVARLAYYFISEFNAKNIPQDTMKKLLDALKKEVTFTSPLRAVMALRALANITRFNQKDTTLTSVVADLLSKFGEEEAKQPSGADKKKRGSTKPNTEQHLLDLLQAQCFCALRTRPQLDQAFFPHIIRGMKCVDPLTARHAMALMYHVASYDPVSARNLMRPFLGHSSELNLSDVSTRVFYVRILSIIGNSTVKEHSKFWRELRFFVLYESTRVAFEAISGLVRGNFKKIQKMKIKNANKESVPLISCITEKIITALSSQRTTEVHAAIRVSQLLAESYILHFEQGKLLPDGRHNSVSEAISESGREASENRSTNDDNSSSEDEELEQSRGRKSISSQEKTRKAAKMKKRYSERSLTQSSEASKTEMSEFEETEDETESSSHQIPQTKIVKSSSANDVEEMIRKSREEETEKRNPLNNLRTTILLFFKNQTTSVYVRSRSLSTIIWMSYAWNAKLLEEAILGEKHSLPAHLFDEVLEDLHWRLQRTPELVDTMLNIFYQLFCTVPAKVNIALVMHIWRSIVELPHGKQKVLQNIFRILDRPHQRETRLITFNIHKNIYWFLGEMANILTNERVFLPKKFANAVDADAASDAYPEYAIQNQAMNAIILRLENACAFSPWEIRVVCVEALAKIAFQSSFPLKLHVYEFLLLCAKEDGSCMYPIIVPVLQILDKLFHLRSKWVNDLKRGENCTPEDKRNLQKEIESVKEQMLNYCSLRHGVKAPLGADVDLFLKQK